MTFSSNEYELYALDYKMLVKMLPETTKKERFG
jgi:hypothetical protein